MSEKYSTWTEFLQAKGLHDWKYSSLGNLFRHRKGKNFPNLPLLAVTGNGGVVRRDSLERRDTSNVDKSKYLRVMPDDIAYNTMRMWQGVSGLSRYEGIVSPAYTICAPMDGISPDYAKHLFKLPLLIQVFHRQSQGLVNDTLNLKFENFSPIKVRIPSTLEQQEIASILTSVDEVIEKTQAQISKLQDLKKGMMQELLTKGIGHTEFKESPVGRIPKEWKLKTLDKVATIQTGVAKSSKRSGDFIEVPYLRVANVQDGYLNLNEIKTIQIEKERLSRFLLQDEDVLVNEGGDFDKLGRGNIWRNQFAPCIHQNHVFVVRTKKNELLSLFFNYLSGSEYGKKYYLGCAKQTTNLASINSSQLKKFPVLLPRLSEQQEIGSILHSIEQRVQIHSDKLRTHRSLKKALMQDLLTGKVRVKVY